MFILLPSLKMSEPYFQISFHLSLLEMSEPDFHFTFQTSKDKTSSFDNDLTPNVLRGVEMDVSPF